MFKDACIIDYAGEFLEKTMKEQLGAIRLMADLVLRKYWKNLHIFLRFLIISSIVLNKDY